MPAVCRAGLSRPDETQLFAAEPLLRHFSECLLHDIVVGTPFTAKFDQQVAGTLLYRCLYPYRPDQPQAPAAALDDYKHWLAWRAGLTARPYRRRFHALLPPGGGAIHRCRYLAGALPRRRQARSLAQDGPGGVLGVAAHRRAPRRRARSARTSRGTCCWLWATPRASTPRSGRGWPRISPAGSASRWTRPSPSSRRAPGCSRMPATPSSSPPGGRPRGAGAPRSASRPPPRPAKGASSVRHRPTSASTR